MDWVDDDFGCERLANQNAQAKESDGTQNRQLTNDLRWDGMGAVETWVP